MHVFLVEYYCTYRTTMFKISVSDSSVSIYTGLLCITCRYLNYIRNISLKYYSLGAMLSFLTAPTSCGYSKFPCHDGQCIDRRYVCNGKNNCYDGSDEDYCNSKGWLFCS